MSPPSTTSSSTARTVTVCGIHQLEASKTTGPPSRTSWTKNVTSSPLLVRVRMATESTVTVVPGAGARERTSW